MKILLVHNTSPRTYGDRIRVERIRKKLLDANFEVVFLRMPIVERFDLLSVNNIQYLPLGIFNFQKVIHSKKYFSSFSSLLTEASIDSVSVGYIGKSIKNLNPDVILAETSKIGSICAIAAKEHQIPCITDIHGLTFAEAIGTGRRSWKSILGFELAAIENSDFVIAVSNNMRDFLTSSFHIRSNRILVCPNGGDETSFHASFNLPLKVIYAGGFVYWEKVFDFLKLAKEADKSQFKFYLAGDGPLRNDLLTAIKKDNIPVSYLGAISRDRIFDVMSKMQIGIAPSTNDLARRVASPIKIYDYLATGLPVVTPRIGDWGNLIATEDCGIALDRGGIDDYLSAINALSHEVLWNQKSNNALRAIREKSSWNQALQPLVDLLCSKF